MSADGEIEVAVQAEGVDEAAGEMGGETLADGDSGGGGVMSGGRGAKILGVLGSIAALLSFIKPILNVLGVVSDILTAFVAPLAAILLRAMAPWLTFLTKLIPIWTRFFTTYGPLIARVLQNFAPLLILPKLLSFGVAQLQKLISWALGLNLGQKIDSIVSTITSLGSKLAEDIMALPDQIGTYLDRLPRMIATAITSRLPDFGFGGGDTGGGSIVDAITNLATGGDGGGGNGGAQVSIGGGLVPFIDSVTTDGRIDFP